MRTSLRESSKGNTFYYIHSKTINLHYLLQYNISKLSERKAENESCQADHKIPSLKNLSGF